MKTVCVITGGGSGMGLAAAKNMPKEKIIVVTGRTLSKLEKAVVKIFLNINDFKISFESFYVF